MDTNLGLRGKVQQWRWHHVLLMKTALIQGRIAKMLSLLYLTLTLLSTRLEVLFSSWIMLDVKYHGIDQQLLDEVRNVRREFFNLPETEKLRIRGYQTLGENVSDGLRDTHEAIDCFRELGSNYDELEFAISGPNQWPETPSCFRSLMEEYILEMQKLSRAILRGIALALGAMPDTFEGDRAGNPFWILRIIGYPPQTPLLADNEFGIGCGEHTDYGLLTLVNQDLDIPALQVRNSAGKWIWADPIPNTLVVNIGDMLEIWMYKPTLDRVLNSNVGYRVSVPFFYEPNFDAEVKPLEFCYGETPDYKPVIYGEHLAKKVLTNFA